MQEWYQRMPSLLRLVPAVMLVLGAALTSLAAPQRSIPDDLELISNAPFGKGGKRTLRLDIVRPRQQPKLPMPVVVFVHGGGWRAGSKEGFHSRMIPLAQRGYFCVSISYRFSQEAVFPAQIEDCKCAVRWVRAHAKAYHVNPNRIGAWGASAGGQLVALLGTSAGEKSLEGTGGWAQYLSRVQAVVDWFGMTDIPSVEEAVKKGTAPKRFIERSGTDNVSLMLGGPWWEKKEEGRRASAITYVSRDDPPFLLCHGELDPLVALEQSERLDAALKKAGVESTLYVVKGEAHGWKGHPEVDEMSMDFFDKHLKSAGGK